jgi:hypothetical protein
MLIGRRVRALQAAFFIFVLRRHFHFCFYLLCIGQYLVRHIRDIIWFRFYLLHFIFVLHEQLSKFASIRTEAICFQILYIRFAANMREHPACVTLEGSVAKVGIRNFSPQLRNSAILRTTKSIAELRTKKSCGTAIADLQNLTSAIPQL